MNFTRKMKLDIRIVLHFRIEEPFALGEVNGMTVFVFCRVLLFETQEIVQLGLVGAGKPAGFVKRQASEFAGSAILL
jgi:hypothetical protein